MSLSRLSVATIVLIGVGFGLALDISASAALNPYQAPSLLALGSGEAAGGAHCSAVPSQ